MNETDPVDLQREFYSAGEHEHLQIREDDFYSAKLTRRLVDHMEIPPDARVLEVGAGFGRFTFHLLEHCASVVALDLTPSALATLDAARAARGIEADRCKTVCADLSALDVDRSRKGVDRVELHRSDIADRGVDGKLSVRRFFGVDLDD